MCNIRAIEIGYLSAETFPIFRIIELGVLEPKVSKGSGRLKTAFDVAGFAIISLTHDNIFFVGELLSKPFLFFLAVRIEFLIYFSCKEL